MNTDPKDYKHAEEWAIAENPKEQLLQFIDPGAGGDEPVKGVMQCHIRQWFDEIELLGNLSIDLNTKLVIEESRLNTVIHVLGGTVEGHPTARHNILQRVRELLAIEDGQRAMEAGRRFDAAVAAKKS